MNNLEILFTHISLFLEQTEELVAYLPYYYSRIIGKEDEKSVVNFLPLGAWVEIWKEIKVNDAGKKLITSDLLDPYFFYGSEKQLLEEESGFRYKYPIPGVSRYHISRILNKYRNQFKERELPLAVSLDQVVNELKEKLPVEQRLSYQYLFLISEVNERVALKVGSNAFTSQLLPAFTGDENCNDDRRLVNSPVFFRVLQGSDMSLRLLVELQVPTCYPVNRGFSFISSGGAAKIADKMQNGYAEMEVKLIDAGFRKLKANVFLETIGIEGLFEKSLDEGFPDEKGIEELANLLLELKFVLETHDLWEEKQKALKITRSNISNFTY